MNVRVYFCTECGGRTEAVVRRSRCSQYRLTEQLGLFGEHQMEKCHGKLAFVEWIHRKLTRQELRQIAIASRMAKRRKGKC